MATKCLGIHDREFLDILQLCKITECFSASICKFLGKFCEGAGYIDTTSLFCYNSRRKEEEEMRTRTASLVLFLAVAVIGCGGKKSSVIKPTAGKTNGEMNAVFDASGVLTLGGHSWVPLYLRGSPDEHALTILWALREFEKAHPELEVTSWSLEKNQKTTSENSNEILGMWINHRPQRR